MKQLTYQQILKRHLKQNYTKIVGFWMDGAKPWQCGGKTYLWNNLHGNTDKLLKFMNEILADTPKSAWPENTSDEDGFSKDRVCIGYKDIYLDLFWVDGVRNANLCYTKDDHTGWIEESPTQEGVFIDSDIGGS